MLKPKLIRYDISTILLTAGLFVLKVSLQVFGNFKLSAHEIALLTEVKVA